MYNILTCLTQEHTWQSILLAVMTLVLATLATVVVFHRGQKSSNQSAQKGWALVSGAVTGVGVWGTHFVAMLGFQPSYTVAFDGLTTALSALLAVFGFMLTSQILIQAMTPLRRLTCATIATATVCSMHYYGMQALAPSALLEYDSGYLLLSVLACGLFFTLTYTVGLSQKHVWRNIVGMVCSILAVATLHFIGMTAIDVIPISGLATSSWALSSETLGIWIFLAVVGMIVTAALAAGLDSWLANLHVQERQRLSALASAASEAILIADSDGIITEVNAPAERLFNRSRGELLDLPLDLLLDVKLPETSGEEVEIVLREHTLRTMDCELPVDITLRRIQDRRSNIVVASLRDLRERIRHEAEIRALAFRDQLTGLDNRASFTRSAKRLIEKADERELAAVVMLVDLDEFKDINDQYGHDAGDAVLVETANRLREHFPDRAAIARLGGDEFAVTMIGRFEREDAMEIAQRCVEKLSQPVSFGSISMRSSASIGVVLQEAGTNGDLASLLKWADRALYAAKEEGRRRARIYDQQLHVEYEARRDLETALVEAVENDEFVLHYQPKVCARTRKVLGYEALIRWERPGVGLISPGAFIPIAEQSALIQQIGRWSIREACMQARRWDDDISVSVNLSARQFLDPGLYASVRDALRRSGIRPERLELEITETALIHNVQVAAAILERMKRLGVQIALDDFGTGYSSMRFVQQFPFDRIKIDGSFVATMGEDRKAYAVIDAILRLGRSLSIPVVAEGVETEEQARALTEAECNELQGYLISRPAPMDKEETEAATPKKKRAAPAA